MNYDVIVTCAVTGAGDTVGKHPAIPVSPKQIADAAIEAAKAGAAVAHMHVRDPKTGKTLVFLTNQFVVPALTICALYKSRWSVELFFKWIKQNLRIKRFYGTSENAVRTQIWIAISVYVLVAIVKKELNLEVSLHTLLQILSVTLFEKMSLQQAVADISLVTNDGVMHNQLNLFEF